MAFMYGTHKMHILQIQDHFQIKILEQIRLAEIPDNEVNSSFVNIRAMSWDYGSFRPP